MIVAPGIHERSVRVPGEGQRPVPDDWILVPPGDPGLTRRVKAGGPCWVVQEKRGRRTFSRGVWAARDRVEAIRAALEQERADPAYARKQAAAAQRRASKQTAYVDEFAAAVRRFLDFPLQYHDLAEQLVQLVTAHATPVGSGTVARTERIPVHRRAESAVIAWLRHQTTAYDHMQIARVKGRRREVRRMLAERSRELLDAYRQGRADDLVDCPLRKALRPPPAADGAATST
ncbi:MAG: DUF2293 domain-containing protein [Planctomycetes bacterium]|nr:DUF2293 domain-containing protein [Planctomycetota bacterium]